VGLAPTRRFVRLQMIEGWPASPRRRFILANASSQPKKDVRRFLFWRGASISLSSRARQVLPDKAQAARRTASNIPNPCPEQSLPHPRVLVLEYESTEPSGFPRERLILNHAAFRSIRLFHLSLIGLRRLARDIAISPIGFEAER
jgi:hypothetical protein